MDAPSVTDRYSGRPRRRRTRDDDREASPYRFLLSRNWVAAAVFVVAAAVVCVFLAQWQYGRYVTKHDRAEVVAANYDASPVPISDVLPEPGSALGYASQWKQVEITGHYDTEDVLYVRNRVVDSDVGYYQLIPFEAADRTLLVVRGFVPGDEDDGVDHSKDPMPAEGQQTITVRLRDVEEVLKDRSNPNGEVQSIAPSQIAPVISVDTPLQTTAYGEAVHESAGSPGGLPLPLAAPDVDLGPHLSYMFQWYVFACFFPIGFVVLARRRASDEAAAKQDMTQDESPDTGDGHAGHDRPVRHHQDEEFEDAVLDGRR